MKSVLQSVAVIGMVVFGCSAEFAAAEGIFPDKNLEKVVRKYVFEKRNNDEPIVADDVINIGGPENGRVVANPNVVFNHDGARVDSRSARSVPPR